VIRVVTAAAALALLIGTLALLAGVAHADSGPMSQREIDAKIALTGGTASNAQIRVS
jgi:hypothetical protein